MLSIYTHMQASYQLRVSQSAIENIHSLDADDQLRVETVLDQVAQNKKPTDHPKVQILNNNHSEKLYKLRIDPFRAILELDSPLLKVHRFAPRKCVYDNIERLYDRL